MTVCVCERVCVEPSDSVWARLCVHYLTYVSVDVLALCDVSQEASSTPAEESGCSGLHGMSLAI